MLFYVFTGSCNTNGQWKGKHVLPVSQRIKTNMASKSGAKKQQNIFSSDPLFCPNCGSIFPLPGLADVVTCKVCTFQKDTKGMFFFSLVSLSTKGMGCLILSARVVDTRLFVQIW